MNYTELFNSIKENALKGTSESIGLIMSELDTADLPVTRAVDFYLGHVDTPEGIDAIHRYLFNGTQIQRNYCALFFERRNDWEIINKAYESGCIDRIQAYSR